MQRDLSRFSLSLGTLALLALAGTAIVGTQPALAQTGSHPCHLLTSAQSIPQGFGAAYNLFSATKELLLNVECGSSSNATLTVGNGQNTMYIYRFGYEWVNGGWKQVALAGEHLAANNWYVGTAKANLSRSEQQLAEDNFVLAYTCLWQNSSWNCGCRDQNCSQNYWQLQAFRQAAPGGGGGQEGLAAKYPKDQGIANHPAVILHENFEGGKFNASWTKLPTSYRFTTEAGAVHSGRHALELVVPQKAGAANAGTLFKRWITGGDWERLYVRWYQKWDAGWRLGTSATNHTGGAIVGCGTECPPGDAGNQANGTNKFYVELVAHERNDREYPAPGNLMFYVYHPDQGGGSGDAFRFSPTFVPRLDKWYSFELMVKINTPGRSDGEIKAWVDGTLAYQKTGMGFRTISSLAIDKLALLAYIGENSARTNHLYRDDIVVATEYIGPMAP